MSEQREQRRNEKGEWIPAVTEGERLVAAATAGIPAALAGRLKGDNLDEVTADARQLAEALASTQTGAGGEGEQAEQATPWLNRLLGQGAPPASTQESEAPVTAGAGFDAGAGSGEGMPTLPTSGARAFDAAIRAHVTGQ